jgi:hypothetical protein
LPASDAASYLVDSFAGAPYRYSVRLTVQLPMEDVAGNFHGFFPGSIEPFGADACVAHFSTETASLLMQCVAGVVALGAEFTVDEATPETAALISDVGDRLRHAVMRPTPSVSTPTAREAAPSQRIQRN